jgi:hypothetical protein
MSKSAPTDVYFGCDGERGNTMSDTKKRAVAIVITSGCELLDANGAPAPAVGAVRRGDMEGLLSGPVLGAGAVTPLFTAEVELDGLGGVTLAPPSDGKAVLENGATLVEEVRAAVLGKEEGRLRGLRAWFPCVLRMREVHAFLDGLPRARALQIAGLKKRGRGRPLSTADQLGRVATLDLLVRVKKISVLQAAKRLAKVPGVYMSEEGLRNLHAKIGKLVACLRDGYLIAEADAPCAPWGQDKEEVLRVYKQPM